MIRTPAKSIRNRTPRRLSKQRACCKPLKQFVFIIQLRLNEPEQAGSEINEVLGHLGGVRPSTESK